jgi:hypothetical protein
MTKKYLVSMLLPGGMALSLLAACAPAPAAQVVVPTLKSN